VKIPRLREWREAKALTQEELAEKADISVRSVAGYEAGGGVRPATVRRLAAVLGIDTADLVEAPLRASTPERHSVDEFDIDEIRETVFVKMRPETFGELNTLVEAEISRRYSHDSLLELRERFTRQVEELAPHKEQNLDAYSKAVISLHSVSRVLERTAGRTLS